MVITVEDILGLLYLEIPFKYKFTKKFKIDDWFQLRPFEKGVTKTIDSSLVARVVINYEANCKLDEKEFASMGHLQEVQKSPKSDFKTKLKQIKKMSVDDKENVNYLEEVERNILLRRRQNRDPLTTSPGKENSQDPTRLLRSTRSTSRLKGSFSRTMTAKKLTPNMSMNPEDMYRTTGDAEPKSITDDKLMAKMQQEIVHSRKELKELRERLKKMEEGLMTVDNLQLSKRLDNEKNGINTERGLLLKEHSKQSQDFEALRKKFLEEKTKAEEEFFKRKALLEKMAKDLDLEKTQYKAISEDLNRRTALAESRDNKLLEQEAEMKNQLEDVGKKKVELAEYQVELSDLKDRLLGERERILKEKQVMEAEKTDLERDIKGLKALKESLEKEKRKGVKRYPQEKERAKPFRG